MKLSEAIRLGATLRPQGFGPKAGCVLWAAAEAVGGIGPSPYSDENYFTPDFSQLFDRFPILWANRTCPVCRDRRFQRKTTNLCTVLWHLNDKHHWSREDIAQLVVEPTEAVTGRSLETLLIVHPRRQKANDWYQPFLTPSADHPSGFSWHCEPLAKVQARHQFAIASLWGTLAPRSARGLQRRQPFWIEEPQIARTDLGYMLVVKEAKAASTEQEWANELRSPARCVAVARDLADHPLEGDPDDWATRFWDRLERTVLMEYLVGSRLRQWFERRGIHADFENSSIEDWERRWQHRSMINPKFDDELGIGFIQIAPL